VSQGHHRKHGPDRNRKGPGGWSRRPGRGARPEPSGGPVPSDKIAVFGRLPGGPEKYEPLVAKALRRKLGPHPPPGIYHVAVAHDAWCPKLKGGRCTCQPEVRIGDDKMKPSRRG
jgi:hypothetical protein